MGHLLNRLNLYLTLGAVVIVIGIVLFALNSLVSTFNNCYQVYSNGVNGTYSPAYYTCQSTYGAYSTLLFWFGTMGVVIGFVMVLGSIVVNLASEYKTKIRPSSPSTVS